MSRNSSAVIKSKPNSVNADAVTDNAFTAEIEYVKRDVTSFIVQYEDVPIRTTADSSRTSYDVMWNLPGYGVGDGQKFIPSSGIMCNIKETKYKFQNVSPNTLYVRMQRPMGYKGAPHALAMWEPIGSAGNELVVPIKPHFSKSFTVQNTSTSHMCPREFVEGGQLYCHLLSFSVFRDSVSDTGTEVTVTTETALQIDIDQSYRCNDGTVGAQISRFKIKAYDTDSRLNFFSVGPVGRVRIGDLRVPSAGMCVSAIFAAGSDYNNLTFTDSNGKQTSTPEGLDTSTFYMLPQPNFAPSSNALQGIIYNTASSNFVLATLQGTKNSSAATTYEVVKVSSSADIAKCVYTSQVYLEPIYCTTGVAFMKAGIRSAPRRVKRVLSALPVGGVNHYLHAHNEAIADTVLHTLVTIAKIVKVGMAIAGMVGIMAVPLPNMHPQSVGLSIDAADSFEYVRARRTTKGSGQK